LTRATEKQGFFAFVSFSFRPISYPFALCGKIVLVMYNVIIVDDESSVRERVTGFLERKKDEYKIIGTYENGYDALLGGVPLEPDLIITDIKMPFINGLELIKRAKQELPLV